MRVVHFSTTDWNEESAIAAYRLHAALCRYGVDSHMLVRDKVLTDLSIWTVRPLDRRKIQWGNWWHEGKLTQTERFYDMRLDRSGIDPLSYPIVRNSDIYIVHDNGGGYIGTQAIERLLKTGKPVLLYLHDLALITGGCRVQLDCPSFTNRCAYCPAGGGSWAEKAASRKHQVYHRYPNLHILAGSEWLRQQVQQSWVGENLKVEVLPYPLDTQLYAVHQRQYTRWMFGIPKKAKCLLFKLDRFMGVQEMERLRNALCEHPLLDWTLVVVSDGHLSASQIPVRCKRVIELHRTYDEATLAALLNAVDLTLLPSLSDGLGPLAVESICCGTPVVGFDSCGLSDWVQEGVNGYLATASSLQDLSSVRLADAIQRATHHLLSTEERTAIAGSLSARVGYEQVIPPFIKQLES